MTLRKIICFCMYLTLYNCVRLSREMGKGTAATSWKVSCHSSVLLYELVQGTPTRLNCVLQTITSLQTRVSSPLFTLKDKKSIQILICLRSQSTANLQQACTATMSCPLQHRSSYYLQMNSYLRST